MPVEIQNESLLVMLLSLSSNSDDDAYSNPQNIIWRYTTTWRKQRHNAQMKTDGVWWSWNKPLLPENKRLLQETDLFSITNV